MKVSLSSLRIKNILSFEDSFIEFGKLSVVIGPNASGKSNLIKVLNFLKKISQGETIYNILIGYFKYQDIKEFYYDPNKDCRIIATFNIDDDLVLYNLEFNSGGQITLEQIQYKSGNKVVDIKNGGSDRSMLFIRTYSDDQIEANLIRNFLQKISAYSFISDNIRSVPQIMEDELLKYDGVNVAAVLHNLLVNDRNRFFRIEDKLKRIFPFVENLNITTRVINYPGPMVSINIDEIKPNKKLVRI